MNPNRESTDPQRKDRIRNHMQKEENISVFAGYEDLFQVALECQEDYPQVFCIIDLSDTDDPCDQIRILDDTLQNFPTGILNKLPALFKRNNQEPEIPRPYFVVLGLDTYWERKQNDWKKEDNSLMRQLQKALNISSGMAVGYQARNDEEIIQSFMEKSIPINQFWLSFTSTSVK